MRKTAGALLHPLFLAAMVLTLLSCSSGGGSSSDGAATVDDAGSESGTSGAASAGGLDTPSSGTDFSAGACATADLDPENLALLSTLFTAYQATHRAARVKDTFAPVPVYFHLITKGDGFDDGNLPDDMIRNEIDVMNSVYAGSLGGTPTPFRFALAGIDRTNKPEWFTVAPGSQEEMDVKKALRKGGPETLNIFTVNTEGGVLGFSTFPIYYVLIPDFDGVIINFRTLVGGPLAHYDRGLVAVHETGHWLGLLHTFQNDCDPIFNDLVLDTPAEKVETKGEFCPVDRDTCPDIDGKDPVHNHMTYTDDYCRSEFTQGQVDFMTFQAQTIRQIS